LGISGLSGRNRTKDDFWHDRRESVKTSLIDLGPFIEVAEKDQVNQVLTQENLTPVVEALLWHPVVDRADPDSGRAEIA
jgi:hypothetical protein